MIERRTEKEAPATERRKIVREVENGENAGKLGTISGYTKTQSIGYEIGTPGNDPEPEKTAVEVSGNLRNRECRADRAERAERAAGAAAAKPTAARTGRAVGGPKPKKKTYGVATCCRAGLGREICQRRKLRRPRRTKRKGKHH